MSRGTSKVRVTDIQEALSGCRYPADRDYILDVAERNKCSDEVWDILKEIPDTDFSGPADLMETLSDFKLIGEEEPQRRSRQRSGQGNGREERGEQTVNARRGTDDPDPSRVSSQRRKDISEEEEERYEENSARRRRNDDEPDHRLQPFQTDAIADARHMRHGYDGRGRVTDESKDGRVGDNSSRAIDDARRMKHGYDGRGRVRKPAPGVVDESIDDDYERYMERKNRRERDPEPDDQGVYSRRRKFQPQK